MKLKEYQIVFAVVFAPLVLLWGCKNNQLVSPTHLVTLGVSLSTQGLKSKLFNGYQDYVYYNVSGPQTDPIQGYAGYFNDNYGSGAISFTLNNIPVGANEILSVEIDDATSGYAQGIGATSLASVDNGVTIEMGSVVRPCYEISPNYTFTCLAGNGGGSINFNQAYVGFDTAEVSTYDMKWVPIEDPTSLTCSNEYDLVSGSGGTKKTIAYLGNSDSSYEQMVNYDFVPPDSQFYADGGAAKLAANGGEGITAIQADDVFCVKLQSGTGTGGHAWVLFTSSGDSEDAPQFRYRLRNDSTPYFSYDVGTTDLAETTMLDSTYGYSNCFLTEETVSVSTLPLN